MQHSRISSGGSFPGQAQVIPGFCFPLQIYCCKGSCLFTAELWLLEDWKGNVSCCALPCRRAVSSSLLEYDLKMALKLFQGVLLVIMTAYINYVLWFSLPHTGWDFVLCAFVIAGRLKFHHRGASTNYFWEFAHHLCAIIKLLAAPDCHARGGECGWKPAQWIKVMSLLGTESKL